MMIPPILKKVASFYKRKLGRRRGNDEVV